MDQEEQRVVALVVELMVDLRILEEEALNVENQVAACGWEAEPTLEVESGPNWTAADDEVEDHL